MATRERVIFNLDRFEWTGPGWLQVWGGWDGMDRRDLAEPTLVVHARGESVRLAPPPDGIRGGIRNWHAIFPWQDDPAAIDGAELELGSGLLVELPAPNSSTGRRRFGRTRLAARELDSSDPAATAVSGAQAAAPGSAADKTGPAPEADPLTVHLAVVAAREETAQARDELELARAAARRATEDVDGERARRQSDAARFNEALETLKRLAEESLQKERGVTQRLSGDLSASESALEDQRTLVSGLRQQMQSLSGELIESREIAEASRAAADGLRIRVEEIEREARQATDGSTAELEALRVDLVESRQVAESWAAESDRTRVQLAEAQQENERAGEEAERLRAHLTQVEREAHQATGEAERLRAQAEEAQQRVEGSIAEVETLRTHFEKAQRQAEQSSAEADRLRAHLERTQQQAQQSGAEAEQLRSEIEAFRAQAAESDALRAELEQTQRSALDATGEAERLRRSLAAVREALQQT